MKALRRSTVFAFLLLFFVAALAIIVASCEQISRPQTQSEDLVSRLLYLKDEKTGLCFAAISSVTHGFYSVVSLTHVPCR
jgi:hypothetical protein